MTEQQQIQKLSRDSRGATARHSRIDPSNQIPHLLLAASILGSPESGLPLSTHSTNRLLHRTEWETHFASGVAEEGGEGDVVVVCDGAGVGGAVVAG